MDVIGDAEVAQDHRRGAERAAFADVRAAGHGDAAGHGGVAPDAHVMADLDLVVELHAFLEHGVVERAAIDVVLAPTSTSSPITPARSGES